jgi:hypothetical protein
MYNNILILIEGIMINDFINSQQTNLNKNGSNKECFLFEDYVLLYGSCKEEELKKLIETSTFLEKKGVAILPTLAYKIVSPPNQLGYTKGYFLQKRAKGTELYNSKMSETEYKKRLNEIAHMSPAQIDLFVSDWLSISEAGLLIDPSKCENFFYSNGRISFIDLNISTHDQPLGVKFAEITNVLLGLGLKSKYKADENNHATILKNVSCSFLKRGLPLTEIQNNILEYDYFMNKDTMNRVITDLAEKQSRNNSLMTGFISKNKVSGR